MKYLQLILLVLVCICCSEAPKQQITSPEQYNSFLDTTFNETYKNALDEKQFWSNRLKADSTGVGDLGPLAGAYEKLFITTGNAQYLADAEQLHKKGIAISAHNKDAYTRALAHNYISQHRFKEAKNLLEESYAGTSHKKATEYMLFDVYMEIGEYDKADSFLGKIKNNTDYNYLIRLAKWSDHKGNLDAAIKYLEQARAIAESRDSKPLKIWTYSNLGDFYGHAGRIQEGYAHYLKTLELQPDNAYAKKGIAWISFAAEENTEEANRILDSVLVQHKVPDYYLLKAEMAEFDGKPSEATNYYDLFLKAVSEGNYGNMYNTYLIEIYAKTNPALALQMAEQEVMNRPTPESFHLLAMAQLANNEKEKALQTIENYVIGKTSEPMSLYHSLWVYKANGFSEKATSLRAELLDAAFELGPVKFEKIEML